VLSTPASQPHRHRDDSLATTSRRARVPSGRRLSVTLTSDPRWWPLLQRIPRTKSGLGSRAQMDSRSGGDLSNHPALGASRPRLCAVAVGNKLTLVCTGVGVESLGRGGRTTLRVSNRVACQISEARRRIPASCPFPESPRRQSRATQASLAASDHRSESASRLHQISPVQPWGENDNLSDRAYGIS